jgi:hypothetical protein
VEILVKLHSRSIWYVFDREVRAEIVREILNVLAELGQIAFGKMFLRTSYVGHIYLNWRAKCQHILNFILAKNNVF